MHALLHTEGDIVLGWPAVANPENGRVEGRRPVDCLVPRLFTLRSSDLWRDLLPRKPSQQMTENLATFIATTDRQTPEYLQAHRENRRATEFEVVRGDGVARLR